MKDSGVEWIGEIPESWKTKKVKSILRETSEKNHAAAEVLSLYRDLGVVIKSTRNDNHNVTSQDTGGYKFVRKNDVVINKMKAWQGSLAVSNYEGIVSPAYYTFSITDNDIIPEFLNYALRNPAYTQEYARLSAGLRVGQWDLSKDAFKKLLYVFPSKEQQKKIVSVLSQKISQIDSIISETQQSIDELKKYKQALITETVTKGLDKNVKMKDSGTQLLGKIPITWDCLKLKYCVKTNDKKDIFLDGMKYVGLEHVNSGDGEINGYSTESSNSLEKTFTVGDVLYSKLRPYLAKAFVANFSGVCSGEFLVLRGFCGRNDFLKYWLISSTFTDFVNATAYGTKMPRSNWDIIKETVMPLPPQNTQEKIVEYLDAVLKESNDLIAYKEDLIDYLKLYKQSLIYEYVTGKKEA
ncbi:restriction endonuclease subunit S [Enterococcus dispar]|nr:restriction endonuclease subunit S [Enterococcus dispar]